MAQPPTARDLSLNVSAATEALLAKLDDDLPTIVRGRAPRAARRPAPPRATARRRTPRRRAPLHAAAVARPWPARRASAPAPARRAYSHCDTALRAARGRTGLPPTHPRQVPEELVMYQFKQAGCNADDNPQLWVGRGGARARAAPAPAPAPPNPPAPARPTRTRTRAAPRGAAPTACTPPAPPLGHRAAGRSSSPSRASTSSQRSSTTPRRSRADAPRRCPRAAV
jgi:hypothetical protein